jgi:hypothetical protein
MPQEPDPMEDKLFDSEEEYEQRVEEPIKREKTIGKRW